MATRYVMQRDTNAWRWQVRISFGLAFACATLGVLFMPGEDLDRAFLSIGMFFCLFATFAVAKMVRDNRDEQVDTGGWVMTVWVAFAIAFMLTGWGLFRMKIGDWQKYYMLVSWLFLVSSSFTLAKTLRDSQEAELLDRRTAALREEAKPAS